MRPLRPLHLTIRLVALGGAALLAGAAGCSLGGLVFDIPSDGTGGGTGSSVSSSGSDTGGAAQSSGSGGSMPGKEDCTNNADDDGDGSIDCEDPDCVQGGYTCHEPIPPDWLGPVVFFHGDEANVPQCSGDYPMPAFEGGYKLVYPDADCSACSCTAPNTICNHPDIGVFTQMGCEMESQNYTFTSTIGTQCGDVMMETGYAFGADAPTVSVPGCKPLGGKPTKSDAVFSQDVIVCSRGAVGQCPGSEKVCVPAKTDAFHGGQCIFQLGYHDCPPPYDDQHVLGTEGELDDFRTCSSCKCTPSEPFSCDLTYKLYSMQGCADEVLSFKADGVTCTDAPNGVTAVSYRAEFTPKGACTASGGTPEGDVWPKTPKTVCCTYD